MCLKTCNNWFWPFGGSKNKMNLLPRHPEVIEQHYHWFGCHVCVTRSMYFQFSLYFSCVFSLYCWQKYWLFSCYTLLLLFKIFAIIIYNHLFHLEIQSIFVDLQVPRLFTDKPSTHHLLRLAPAFHCVNPLFLLSGQLRSVLLFLAQLVEDARWDGYCEMEMCNMPPPE